MNYLKAEPEKYLRERVKLDGGDPDDPWALLALALRFQTIVDRFRHIKAGIGGGSDKRAHLMEWRCINGEFMEAVGMGTMLSGRRWTMPPASTAIIIAANSALEFLQEHGGDLEHGPQAVVEIVKLRAAACDAVRDQQPLPWFRADIKSPDVFASLLAHVDGDLHELATWALHSAPVTTKTDGRQRKPGGGRRRDRNYPLHISLVCTLRETWWDGSASPTWPFVASLLYLSGDLEGEWPAVYDRVRKEWESLRDENAGYARAAGGGHGKE